MPSHRRLALLIPLWLAACASVPQNTVHESLDERTGTTLTRLEKPIELLALEPRGANLDPFAYLAPFETNRMGRRTMYLWIAVPDEKALATAPELLVDGQPLAIKAAGADSRAVGLAAQPYASPAPWSAVSVFELDAPQLATVTGAQLLQVQVRYGNTVLHFEGRPTPPGVLQDFATRLGLH